VYTILDGLLHGVDLPIIPFPLRRIYPGHVTREAHHEKETQA
jgi:hypothetical protein